MMWFVGLMIVGFLFSAFGVLIEWKPVASVGVFYMLIGFGGLVLCSDGLIVP